MGSCSFALASPTCSTALCQLIRQRNKVRRTQGSRWPIIMEPLFHLLALLTLPYDSQARPEYPVTLPGGAWAWGRVGDQPKPVTATAAAEEEEFETIFAVSGDSASAAPLLSSQTAVIELTTPSPPVTLEDGRWSWGVVETV